MTAHSSLVVRAMTARGRPSSLNLGPADEFQEKIVRNILVSALAAGAAAYALPASAQNTNVGSAQMIVETNIPTYCSQLVSPDEALDLGNLTGATGQLVTAFAQNSTKQLATGFYCNAPSKVKIEAEPLKSELVTMVGDSSSFTNRVDYTAALTWNGQNLQVLSTDADGEEFSVGQANIGDLALELSEPKVAGNLRPVAGGYAGLVRLTISIAQ
jgi:hypothetical protein